MSSAVEMRDAFKTLLEHMEAHFAGFPALRDQEVQLRQIRESVDSPFTLAVFGRMKTGKSSIINALVGRPIAITGVEEATATLNWISHGDASQESLMEVHWKNGLTEPMDLAKLSDWAGKDPEVLERVSNTAFLQLFANIARLRDVQIIDTPGTGSVVDEHEEAARSFLSPRAAEDSESQGRKADALLYVFPPVARESDESSLLDFRKTRLPGSDPYNTIGVLHKWDGLETEDGDIAAEAERKASRLSDMLGDCVSTVIPVSAPLALVSRHAPESYLNDLLTATMEADKAGGLSKALRRTGKWDVDAFRASTRQSYDLPWVSFVRLVNLIKEHEPVNAEDLRQLSLKASGFLLLESELDNRLFKNAQLIKQRLAGVKAKEPIRTGLRHMDQRVEELEVSFRHLQSVANSGVLQGPAKSWLDKKIAETANEQRQSEEATILADQMWLREESRQQALEKDLKCLDEIERNPSLIEERDLLCIKALLRSAAEEDVTMSPVLARVLVDRYQGMLHSPRLATRQFFEHVLQKLTHRL